MNIMRIDGVLAAAAIMLATSTVTAHAVQVNYTDTGSCSLTDFSPSADDCFGLVVPNANNSSDPDADTPQPVAAYNTDTFDGVLGLFGKTTWELIADDDPNNAGATDGLEATLNGTGGGSWSYSGSLAGFDFITAVLKQGPTHSAYLFSTKPFATGGTFSLAAFGSSTTDLSHLTLYGVPGAPVGAIPLPASALLLLGGIGGLGALRRLRRKA